jgi:hypothetical protein
MRPEKNFLAAATAFFKPMRSRAASPGRGGKRPLLAKRKAAPQYRETRAGKGICQLDEQRHVRVSTRAVREHQAVAVR